MLEVSTPRELAQRVDELDALAEIVPEGMLAYRVVSLTAAFLQSALGDEAPEMDSILQAAASLAPGIRHTDPGSAWSQMVGGSD